MRDGFRNLYFDVWSDVPRQTLSAIETSVLEKLGLGTKAAIVVTLIAPQVEKQLIKGLMIKLLWLWISSMQLFTTLSLIDVDVPENVLRVEEQFNDILYLQFLSKDMVRSIVSVFRGEEIEEYDIDEPESSRRRLET